MGCLYVISSIVNGQLHETASQLKDSVIVCPAVIVHSIFVCYGSWFACPVFQLLRVLICSCLVFFSELVGVANSSSFTSSSSSVSSAVSVVWASCVRAFDAYSSSTVACLSKELSSAMCI